QELSTTAHVSPLQPADLHLIYQGRILNDEQPLAAIFKHRPLASTDHYTYRTVTIAGVRYLLQLTKDTPHSQHAGRVDTASLVQAMIAQKNQHNGSTVSPSHGRTSNGISERQRREDAIEAEAEAQRRVREQEQQQREQEAEERMQNERVAHFWLLARLAFFSYLFSQNATIGQMFMVHLVALVIFLYQTNRLAFLQAWWARRHQWPLPWHGANQPAPPMAEHGGEAVRAMSSPSDDASATLPVSRWGQVERALTTFVTSLVPTEPDGIDPLGMEQEGEMANEMF
ncbi:hypothetical protein SYNPS1DRAFT_24333, partial [Syncephalis pseudoplumigaleata]